MFHYRRDIDAWQRRTKRLSATEKGVYIELLDELYATELPLPNNFDELYRIAGATKPDERKAVEKVMARFFELTDDGYTQERASEEIAEYHAQAEKNKNNGKKGGRPPKNKTQNKPINNPVGFQWVTETVGNANPKERQSVNPLNQSNFPVENFFPVVGVISPNRPERHSAPPARPLKPGAFAMDDGWYPEPVEDFRMRVQFAGVHPDYFTDALLTEFISYWRGKGDLLTHAEWEHKLLQRVKNVSQHESQKFGGAT